MREYMIPPRLPRGACIGVVAPASPPSDIIKIEKGVDSLIKRGYSVLMGKSVHASDGYLAGSDMLRAEDLHRMFSDTSVHAIVCTRGGYGSGRVLPLLDWKIIRRHPKIFIGYSDITALQMAMLRKASLVSFSGPMLASDMWTGLDAMSEKALFSLLHRPRARFRLCRVEAEKRFTCNPGIAEGRLVGGNFTVLMSLMGTPYEPDWTDSVLFLEDVGENIYKIDRMLAQLHNAGVLRRLAAVLLGHFTSIPEDGPNRELNEVFTEYFSPLHIPVLGGIPFGHQNPKITLPLGAVVRVNVAHGTLDVTQAVVS